MNWLAQIWINGFAAALFLCLVAQLPEVVSLRWWLGATGIGFCAALLQWAAGRASLALIAPLLFLCLVAQLGCVLCGLLWYSSRARYVKFALGGSLALGVLLLFLCGGSTGGISVARGLVSLLVLLLLLAHLAEYRKRYPWTIHLISAVLIWGVLRQLTAITVGLHWLSPGSMPLLSSAWEFVYPFGSGLALLFLGICDVALRDKRLSARVDQMRQLVEGTDKGLCEIDRAGQITFANWAASSQPTPGFRSVSLPTTRRYRYGRSPNSLYAPQRTSPTQRHASRMLNRPKHGWIGLPRPLFAKANQLAQR
jgi:PAS domain-containing protein